MTGTSAWPLRLSAREGRASARYGRWTSLFVLFVAALTVAAGAVDAVGVTRLIEHEQEWIDAGGYALVVTGGSVAGEFSPISTEACERLVAIEGVEASFALRQATSTAALAHVPGGRASEYHVSPGALVFFGVAPHRSGTVLVSLTFAGRTGVQDGEEVILLTGGRGTPSPSTPTTTVRTVDTMSIGDQFDGALLIPSVISGSADVCFVRTDAKRYNAVRAVLPELLSHEGVPAVPSPRLVESAFNTDFISIYEERPLRWLWLPCALLLGILWAMLQWFRRASVAIYATFGMPTASRLVMQFAEWAVLAGLGLMLGWGTGVVWALALGARTTLTLTTLTFHGLLTVLSASLLVVLIGIRPAGNLLSNLKDR